MEDEYNIIEYVALNRTNYTHSLRISVTLRDYNFHQEEKEVPLGIETGLIC